jgi:hypothetical protein
MTLDNFMGRKKWRLNNFNDHFMWRPTNAAFSILGENQYLLEQTSFKQHTHTYCVYTFFSMESLVLEIIKEKAYSLYVSEIWTCILKNHFPKCHNPLTWEGKGGGGGREVEDILTVFKAMLKYICCNAHYDTIFKHLLKKLHIHVICFFSLLTVDNEHLKLSVSSFTL